MALCEAEPLGLGLESPSPVNPSNAIETLNAKLENLKLEEEPESKSDELDNREVEEKSEEKDDDGDKKLEALSEITVSEGGERSEKDPEQADEVKVDGWGWDQDFGTPEANQSFEKDPDWCSEEKVEVFGAFGWDQVTGGSEENAKSDWCSEEKVEVFGAFGWEQETGGTEGNAKSEKGSESWDEEKGQRKKFPFAQRPSEADCAFYMKTGTCRYGLNCRFNHPPSKLRNKGKFRKLPESGQDVELNENGWFSKMVGQAERQKPFKENKMGTLSESNRQMDCKYYSMPGGCKFGSACKYNHKEKSEVPAQLNFLGLPMRPGEKECTYYMSTGSCKYSINCRFHHPEPIVVGGQDNSSGYQNDGTPQHHAPPPQLQMTSWPMQRTPDEPGPFLDTQPPYVTGFYVPPQGLHPNPEWNGYQAPGNPLFPAEMSMPHSSSTATMRETMHMGNGSAPKKAPDGEYPERPGQPECQFFMKTGTCKFKSACKFHHPKSRLPKTSEVDVSPVGLPLRPDQLICPLYSRHGICRHGRFCRYHHPMDSSRSFSSAAVAESSQKIYPETAMESQGVKAEGSSDLVQESGW